MQAKIYKNKLSPIWLIPIVTLLLGIWFIFQYVNNQGIKITIITQNAEGLLAGKTSLKSKNVNIGIIDNIKLHSNLQEVILEARIFKGMEDFLREDSVFYTVKPKIGKEGISGIGTIFSGAYIEVIQGSKKTPLTHYDFALQQEEPIIINPNTFYIHLESNELNGINRGDSVLFRGLKVGVVENSFFNQDKLIMEHKLVIYDRYHSLLTENISFWKSSGISFKLSPNGASLDIASLESILYDSVSFDILDNLNKGGKLKNNQTFKLYSNFDEIRNTSFAKYKEFLVFFKDSVKGLSEGANVEFAGVKVGTVLKSPFKILSLKEEKDNYLVPVLIKIEPERIADISDIKLDEEIIDSILNNGSIRASLKTSNLITGSLIVGLSIDARSEVLFQEKSQYGYDVIPTINTGFDEIQQKLDSLVGKINSLPIEDLLKDFSSIVQNSNKLISGISYLANNKNTQSLPENLNTTLQTLNKTLQGIAPGSGVYDGMNNDINALKYSINELNYLLNSLNQASSVLIDKPNSDPIPRRKK